MNLRHLFSGVVMLAAFFVLLIFLGAFYVVPETEQVILTQFGQPVGEPVKDAGVHFKLPFAQTVNRFDKRVLEWDGPASQIQTKEKLYIIVDTFARWRIADPLRFFLRLRDERSALSRLDDIIGGETRNTIARHQLVELIRTTKDRKPAQDETLTGRELQITELSPIQFGRVALEKEVTDQSRAKLQEFGIELLDVRFLRINYNPTVSSKIYDRMISERRQIAERFRSEGAGEAAKILGTREREIKRIESEAYQKAQTTQGKADAEAIKVYAEAFNQNPEARGFYEFSRSLEVYRSALAKDTTAVLNLEDGFLRHFKGEPAEKLPLLPPPPAPAPAPPKPAATPAPAPPPPQ